MAQKWTDARREKFKRTMAAKRAITVTPVEEIGPRRKRRSPNEAEDFARFMAAAWKLYKRG